MSETLKKLTGKNPKDFKPVVYSLVNNPDEELFKELVDQDDYLFDFVKENVSNRIDSVCNEKNFKNLLRFLKYYSPFYEDVIVSNLVKFADEDITDEMLDYFENGSIAEKTYCAKFFEYIQDPLSLEYLLKYSYDQDSYLSSNCAATLAAMNEKSSYEIALNKLNSDDDFEIFSGVKFLCAYSNSSAIPHIIEVLKKSSMPENIASELLYLTDIFSLFSSNKEDGLLVLNSIINGIGEILPLSQILDFQLYEVFEKLKNGKIDSKTAIVLLNAKEKFDILTENEEYLFDEQKDVKNEVFEIKNLLSELNVQILREIGLNEIRANSLFVYSALDFAYSEKETREILKSDNQTLILRALEALKNYSDLTPADKELALKTVTDENLQAVIEAM